ncbi:pentraxin fusion protein-like [Haliotis cracherodii]|uniref:pentraxin fusion protein-like n=1 Tax=Haliotis cracherodii TaxID=6455 RepID=UPI0039EC0CDA
MFDTICCLILTCMFLLGNACMPELQYGQRLVGSTFKVTDESSLFTCAAECGSYGICKSFNFELRRRACHLNSLDELSCLEGSRKEPDFIYSSISSWNQTPLGPCRAMPCRYTHRCNGRRNGKVNCAEEGLHNIAKNKPTNASSLFDKKHQPSVAVDGDLRARWSFGSCFHVKIGDLSPWWQVDLRDTYIVVEVRVTSRQDCCTKRLHDFSLDMYQADPMVNHYLSSQLCYMYSGAVTEPGKTVAIQCTSPVTGRYLRVSGKKTKNRNDLLQFCEVEVFGFKLIHW